MRLIQQQIEELSKLDVPLTRAADFDSFWADTSERVKKHDLGLKMTRADYPLDGVKIYDSVFHGLDGTPVRCWIMIPERAGSEPFPTLLNFHGGNGHRGNPSDFAPWIMNGRAVISMDFRLQGGLTGSNTPLAMCGAASFAVMSILDHRSYYLWHAWTDAMLAVKITENLGEMNPDRVAVSGTSQGGGTSMVMAALNHRVALCLAAVPSYCWWDRRIFIRSACAAEISRFIERYPDLTETVFRTMSYYDVVNFAPCPLAGQSWIERKV